MVSKHFCIPPPLILLFVFIFPKVLVISRFLLEKKISLSFYDSCINCRKKLLSSTQNFGFYLSLQANCLSFTQETDYALSHDFISMYMVNWWSFSLCRSYQMAIRVSQLSFYVSNFSKVLFIKFLNCHKPC